MGGAVARGSGQSALFGKSMPRGTRGPFNDPLFRLYEMAGLFDRKGPNDLGPNRSDMTIGNSSKDYSFDEPHQSGGDYEVGEGPAVSSGYTENTDTHIGAVGRGRQRTSPGGYEGDRSKYFRDEIERSKRDEMKINDPTVEGVKTDKGKRRGGSGKSRGGKKGEGKGNYYEDKASGTGVHT
tara:strand:+ start:352 stop:894 length:543 start_codon:yes stop_codon:yes gene_type:complete